jgi:uncharacterized protein YjiS (DUF1127 family)
MANIINQDNANFHPTPAGRTVGLANALPEITWPTRLLSLFDNWLKRGMIVGLGQLDDRLLRDIGMDRGDLLWAMNLPITVDAETQLMIRVRSPGRSLW